MRIVHLSSSDIRGGAARAAYRLHKALLRAGEESIMLVGSKFSNAESVCKVPPISDNRSQWAHLVQTTCIERNRTELSNTYFSLGWPGLNVADHPVVASADILHLHWVSGLLSHGSIARLQQLRKPLVWTLHDQRAFTGGCHYSAGCENFTATCQQCPQLVADRWQLPTTNLNDQQCLYGREALTIVALCRWMAECVTRSRLLRHCRVEIIPNSIETEVFVPVNKAEARARLGWPPGGVCILLGADNGEEKRKGFAELLGALELCLADEAFTRGLQEERIFIACFGRPNQAMARSGIPFTSLGYVSSDSDLALIYGAASFFLLPSLEDNLPNTVLEAMSCGTAVAAFDCGGVPDMVSDPLTGRLAPAGDVQALSRIVLSFCSEPGPLDHMGRAAREIVEMRYTSQLQTQKMLALYDELLAPARNKVLKTTRSSVTDDYSFPVSIAADGAGPAFQTLFPRLLLDALAENPTMLHADARAKRALEAALVGELSHAELLDVLDEYPPVHGPEESPPIQAPEESPPARTKRKSLRHLLSFRRWR
jgi:glycosyltransferase involved in cell wall biosynthesis